MRAAIKIAEFTGIYALDTDMARTIRLKHIEPGLGKARAVKISFKGVEIASLSFIHALLYQVVKRHGKKVFRKLYFTHCNECVASCITAWHHAYI